MRAWASGDMAWAAVELAAESCATISRQRASLHPISGRQPTVVARGQSAPRCWRSGSPTGRRRSIAPSSSSRVLCRNARIRRRSSKLLTSVIHAPAPTRLSAPIRAPFRSLRTSDEALLPDRARRAARPVPNRAAGANGKVAPSCGGSRAPGRCSFLAPASIHLVVARAGRLRTRPKRQGRCERANHLRVGGDPCGGVDVGLPSPSSDQIMACPGTPSRPGRGRVVQPGLATRAGDARPRRCCRTWRRSSSSSRLTRT
jgi:hypothetical protein